LLELRFCFSLYDRDCFYFLDECGISDSVFFGVRGFSSLPASDFPFDPFDALDMSNLRLMESPPFFRPVHLSEGTGPFGYAVVVPIPACFPLSFSLFLHRPVFSWFLFSFRVIALLLVFWPLFAPVALSSCLFAAMQGFHLCLARSTPLRCWPGQRWVLFALFRRNSLGLFGHVLIAPPLLGPFPFFFFKPGKTSPLRFLFE